MSRPTTPAEYWNEGNALMDAARQRFADGDHGAVGPLCALAQANFSAAATKTAIIYADQAMAVPQPIEPEAVIDPGEGLLT